MIIRTGRLGYWDAGSCASACAITAQEIAQTIARACASRFIEASLSITAFWTIAQQQPDACLLASTDLEVDFVYDCIAIQPVACVRYSFPGGLPARNPCTSAREGSLPLA
jgi:hypothetical protein